jgi:HPt (histidine-containing phosphotransfer) domain-containing protein
MMHAPTAGRFFPAMLSEATDHDPALMVELLDIFLRTTPPRVERLRQGIAERLAATVAQEAHGLKSTLALVGAMDASATCEQVEAMAQRARVCPDAMTSARLFSQLAQALEDAAHCRAHHRTLMGQP